MCPRPVQGNAVIDDAAERRVSFVEKNDDGVNEFRAMIELRAPERRLAKLLSFLRMKPTNKQIEEYIENEEQKVS